MTWSWQSALLGAVGVLAIEGILLIALVAFMRIVENEEYNHFSGDCKRGKWKNS
jgi:hypothetical protein